MQPVRLDVNVHTDVADVLRSYADRHGVSITDAVAVAIGTLHAFDELAERGARVLVREPRRWLPGHQLREVTFR